MSFTRIAFTTLVATAALIANAGLAATFTSDTHIVDYTVDGIEVTGANTTVTINAPAIVTPIPGTAPELSLLIDNGAHVIINGGEFSGRVHVDVPLVGAQPTLEIFGGTFDRVHTGTGTATIYGGTFAREVVGANTPLNVYGGTFERLGFDATYATVNVYGRSFTFGNALDSEINGIFPGANFPLDHFGESFSMTTDVNPFIFSGRDVSGVALDGSPISFTTLLDGMGSFNLIIVPEPSSMALIAFAMLSSIVSPGSWRRRRNIAS